MDVGFEAIRVFVGTDQRSGPAEKVLEHSIRKNTTMPVEITWMRAGEGRFTAWTYQPSLPHQQYTWATPFTCFRYGVPEFAGFEGKAIYLDSDMIVFGDLAELWTFPQIKPWRTLSHKRTDVSIINCAHFKDRHWWPTVNKMKTQGVRGPQMRNLLHQNGCFEFTVPDEWDSLDVYEPGKTKLLHYTKMQTQPWKPWPEVFPYDQPHPNPHAGHIWEVMAKEAKV